MKNRIWIFIVFALLLSSCSQVTTTIPNTKEAKQAQIIMEQYLSANRSANIDQVMSLYADNVVWMDHGMDTGPFNKADLDALNRMSVKEVKENALSYLLTPDGRFAVLQTNLTMPNVTGNKTVTTLAIGVLEFKDGKIINETWYYDGEVYKQ